MKMRLLVLWSFLCVGCCTSVYEFQGCEGNPRCIVCSGNNCTQCNPGYYGHDCLSTCPLPCRTCDQQGQCLECIRGFYGTQCEKECDVTCVQGCNRSTGACLYLCSEDPFCRACHENTCTVCVDGKFGDQCKGDCPENCVACTQNDMCTSCKRGFYGNACAQNCSSTCLNGECDKVTGECRDHICDLNPNCARCHRNECIECLPGKHGVYCNLDCPHNCEHSCTMNGTCLPYKCSLRYYGPDCVNCSDACFIRDCEVHTGVCKRHSCEKNPHCALCQGNRCVECKVGRHGNYCEFSCPSWCPAEYCTSRGYCLCGNNQWGPHCLLECPETCLPYSAPGGHHCDVFDGRCSLCKFTWWGDHCQHQLCQHNTRCQQCYGQSCSSCLTGYWGTSCNRNCTKGCSESNGCFKQSGHCKRCRGDVTWGNLCDALCPSECDMTCEQQTGHCLRCPPGKYGTRCQHKCSGQCAEDICHIDTGVCSKGCEPGFQAPVCRHACADGKYGQDCSQQCSAHCGTMCNKVNGSCSCQAGYTGHRCDMECPRGTSGHNCQDNCSTNCAGACDHVTGYCSGCKAGWTGLFCHESCANGQYGHNCAYQCSAGCINHCDMQNGHCVCRPGFTGDKCGIFPGYHPRNPSSNNTWAIGLMGGLLGAALFVFLGFVIFVVLKRRRRAHEATSESVQFSQFNNPAYTTDSQGQVMITTVPAPQHPTPLPQYTEAKQTPQPAPSTTA